MNLNNLKTKNRPLFPLERFLPLSEPKVSAYCIEAQRYRRGNLHKKVKIVIETIMA